MSRKWIVNRQLTADPTADSRVPDTLIRRGSRWMCTVCERLFTIVETTEAVEHRCYPGAVTPRHLLDEPDPRNPS